MRHKKLRSVEEALILTRLDLEYLFSLARLYFEANLTLALYGRYGVNVQVFLFVRSM